MDDYWDSNWLSVTAIMEANGARVESSGTFLRNTEISEFLDEVRTLHKKLQGTASLSPLEPDLSLQLEGDGLGGIEVSVDLTPDHLSQQHKMSFVIDQTYLQPLINSCEAILEKYPIRAADGD